MGTKEWYDFGTDYNLQIRCDATYKNYSRFFMWMIWLIYKPWQVLRLIQSHAFCTNRLCVGFGIFFSLGPWRHLSRCLYLVEQHSQFYWNNANNRFTINKHLKPMSITQCFVYCDSLAAIFMMHDKKVIKMERGNKNNESTKYFTHYRKNQE